MTEITERLEPCRFCNSTLLHVERADYSSCYVHCSGCGAHGPIGEDESDDDEEGEDVPGRAAAIAAWNRRGSPGAGALPDGMSARQAAVLSLVRQGKSNKCIARELEIAESTVKCHVAVVMRKLGARNRTEVVVKAASQGCA